jgi:hypothetical protein
MRLEMRRVYHNPLRFGSFACKGHENTIKYAHAAQADEAIMEGVVRSILFRRVLPLQAVADQINDSADNPPVIYAGNAMSEGVRTARCETTACHSIKKDHS